MDPASLVVAAVILGGVGTVFGLLIALTHARFKVWEDPRIDAVTDMLPGANCGACGQAGCRAFAEELVSGHVQPAGCTVMSEDERVDVATLMGVDAGAAVKRVARLLCAGGEDVAPRRAEYRGLPTCGASAAVAGGGKDCSWGCLGLGDCEDVCDFDAITMGPSGLPVVDVDRCTACGDCVEVCPKDLFVLMPIDRHLIVQCRSLLEGEEAEAACRVACTGCGKCALDAKPGVIEIVSGLARVDDARFELAGPEAIGRCPTGAIVWVEGGQFESPDGSRGRALARSEA